MSLPNIGLEAGRFRIAIAAPDESNLLHLELMAMVAQGRGHMIASPHLLTLDGETAEIASGDQVPYQEKTSSGATSTDFKKALLSLEVTPTIANNQHVLLRLQVNQNKVSPLTIENIPLIRTQEVKTQVRVRSGDTLVLGGVMEESIHHQHQGVPILSRLPIIGNVFKQRVSKTQHKELLILVTPVIIMPTSARNDGV